MEIRYVGAQSAKRPSPDHPVVAAGETVDVLAKVANRLLESGDWEKTTTTNDPAAEADDEPKEG